jgi:hypothetical protein
MKLRRLGFSISLDDDGTVYIHTGGSDQFDRLMSGMFGMSSDELAARVAEVILRSDSVDDSVVSRLILFPGLRDLSFCSTPHVTPAGLGVLSELKNLQSLHLVGTWLTDDHFGQLVGMVGLQRILIVESCDVTDAAIASLTESLPGVEIQFDPARG